MLESVLGVERPLEASDSRAASRITPYLCMYKLERYYQPLLQRRGTVFLIINVTLSWLKESNMVRLWHNRCAYAVNFLY